MNLLITDYWLSISYCLSDNIYLINLQKVIRFRLSSIEIYWSTCFKTSTGTGSPYALRITKQLINLCWAEQAIGNTSSFLPQLAWSECSLYRTLSHSWSVAAWVSVHWYQTLTSSFVSKQHSTENLKEKIFSFLNHPYKNNDYHQSWITGI